MRNIKPQSWQLTISVENSVAALMRKENFTHLTQALVRTAMWNAHQYLVVYTSQRGCCNPADLANVVLYLSEILDM